MCVFRVPSSLVLPSCSEHAQCCCPCWLPSSFPSTTDPTCVAAATKSTTTARRATPTARRADPARAKSLSWRTAAYNPTDEGGGDTPQTPSRSPTHVPRRRRAVHLFQSLKEDDSSAPSCSPAAWRTPVKVLLRALEEPVHIIRAQMANRELPLGLVGQEVRLRTFCLAHVRKMPTRTLCEGFPGFYW